MAAVQKVSQRIRNRFLPFEVPLFLLAVTLLAYSILLPQMGFYWDDWPWIWLQHLDGKQGMLQIDRAFRPLSGVILFLISLFAGEQPFLWQLTNLLLRWFSSLTCFLVLKALFPRQTFTALGGALLFLLFPAYQHQFVAVNSSRHLLPFSFYFLSLFFMIQAVRREKRAWFFHGLALAFQLSEMLATEYYYGLECVRPFVIFTVLKQRLGGREAVTQMMKQGMPYFGLLVGLVAWRFATTRRPDYTNYALLWQEDSDPLSATNGMLLLRLWGEQLKVGMISAWTKLFEFPHPATFGARKTVLYSFLGIAGGTGVYFYLSKTLPRDLAFPGKSGLLLGICSLVLAGLPFLAAGLRVDISFPANRLTLPQAFGASLLLISLIELLLPKKSLQVLMLSGICALAIGSHFQNATDFQRDWAYQRAFFQQLSWRVPGIQPNTLILSNIVEQTHSSDNSLTAALNWFYFDRFAGEQLPLLFFYPSERTGASLQQLERGARLERRYGRFIFHGNPERILVVDFNPPACLRVIHPVYDRANPWLSRETRQLAPLSNLQIIKVEPKEIRPTFPITILERQEVWCYAYQRADLARQQERWQEVIFWYETASEWGDSPNRADETVPLLQAYAFQGNWQAALQTTSQIARTAKRYVHYLCEIWGDLAVRNQPPQAILNSVQGALQCSP